MEQFDTVYDTLGNVMHLLRDHHLDLQTMHSKLDRAADIPLRMQTIEIVTEHVVRESERLLESAGDLRNVMNELHRLISLVADRVNEFKPSTPDASN